MSEEKEFKTQRDQFLAFAFASADLLLEIDGDGKVKSSFGACNNLLGVNDKDIIGENWLDHFIYTDQSYIFDLKKKITPGLRLGPVFVTLNHKRNRALFSAIQMPKSDDLFVTIALAKDLGDLIHDSDFEQDLTEVRNKNNFAADASEKIASASDLGKDTSLTLIDMDISQDFKTRVGDEKMALLMDSMMIELNRHSLGENSAGEVSENRYGIVHDASQNAENLLQKSKTWLLKAILKMRASAF